MAKKISSYQKLKAENKSLRDDIFNIVMNEKNAIGQVTKLRYKLHYEMIELALKGNSTHHKTEEPFEGFYSLCKPNVPNFDKNFISRWFLNHPGIRIKTSLLSENTKAKLQTLKQKINGNHNS